jgi:hypothetical protein
MYLIAIAVALLVALSFLGSPLIAAIIVIPLAVVGLVFMSSQRRRSAWEDQSNPAPLRPEGRPTSPTGSRSRGAPASGEGET